MSPQQQSRLALQMPKVAWEFKACFNDCPDPAEYASLHLPVQILCGTKSPAPVRWIGTKLSDLVPGAIVNKLVGLDHMAPVHSPAAINPLLLKFVRGVAPGTFGKSRAA